MADDKIKKEDIPTVEEYEDYIRKDSRLMFKVHVTASLATLEGILVSSGVISKEKLDSLIKEATDKMIHDNAVNTRQTLIDMMELANSEPDVKEGK